MLANFKNSFTVGFSSKLATSLVSYFPPHRNCVTTLPCEQNRTDFICQMN